MEWEDISLIATIKDIPESSYTTNTDNVRKESVGII